MSNGYEGYIPGPTMPTVPLHQDYFNLVHVPATAGLPVFTPMVTSVPIPGTIGQSAPVLLAITGAAYAPGR